MASTKRISYHWRVFVPMVAGLWIIIGCMSWWQVYRVRETRMEFIYDQLRFLTDRLVELDEQPEEMVPYMEYINNFYDADLQYDRVSIKTYDKARRRFTPLIGPNVYVPENQLKNQSGTFESVDSNTGAERTYLYYCHDDKNGTHNLITMLPVTKKVAQTVAPVTVRFWIIMIVLGLISTFMAYISTSYIVSNIRFLRAFTRRAAHREDFDVTAVDNLPDDELGDISRDIVSIYVQLTDEIDRSEHEHKVAIAAIEEKSRIKRKLTANINHEIRTPIGIIKGYVDTILGDPEMPEEVKQKFLLKIQQNVNRLTELIADIAVITKYEHGEQLVAISEINFHDLVYTFADELKMADLGKDVIPFTFDVPLKCNVSGNEALLRSMLSNLVRNARLYSQGTMCRLELEKEDDKFYYFSFYDDGVGVPPEAIARLFERFFRVKEGRERNSGGTGLGLPIVKVAIESFGGTIEVANRTPSGLIFHFSLVKSNPGK